MDNRDVYLSSIAKQKRNALLMQGYTDMGVIMSRNGESGRVSIDNFGRQQSWCVLGDGVMIGSEENALASVK